MGGIGRCGALLAGSEKREARSAGRGATVKAVCWSWCGLWRKTGKGQTLATSHAVPPTRIPIRVELVVAELATRSTLPVASRESWKWE